MQREREGEGGEVRTLAEREGGVGGEVRTLAERPAAAGPGVQVMSILALLHAVLNTCRPNVCVKHLQAHAVLNTCRPNVHVMMRSCLAGPGVHDMFSGNHS